MLWETAALTLPSLAIAQAQEDMLVTALSADVTTFDFAQVSERGNSNMLRHIFDPLELSMPAGTLAPGIAGSLEIRRDDTGYIYTIREGLRYHDGEPMDAHAVAYGFNRIGDPANGFSGNSPGFVFSGIQLVVGPLEDMARLALDLMDPLADLGEFLTDRSGAQSATGPVKQAQGASHLHLTDLLRYGRMIYAQLRRKTRARPTARLVLCWTVSRPKSRRISKLRFLADTAICDILYDGNWPKKAINAYSDEIPLDTQLLHA